MVGATVGGGHGYRSRGERLQRGSSVAVEIERDRVGSTSLPRHVFACMQTDSQLDGLKILGKR